MKFQMHENEFSKFAGGGAYFYIHTDSIATVGV